MNLLLYEKNVLITGAGRNIGRSIALEMAKHGANIYFTDIDKELKENLEKELSFYPIKFRGFLSDITRVEETVNLCNTLEKNQIYIDILVNNLGLSPNPKNPGMLDLDEWRYVFNNNVFGPLYLTQQISQAMIKKKIKGSLLFISSIHQWVIRRIDSYSASKAAIGMLIKELAIELAPHCIRVNGIAPGYIYDYKRRANVGIFTCKKASKFLYLFVECCRYHVLTSKSLPFNSKIIPYGS